MPSQKFPFITEGYIGDVPNGFYPAKDSERGVILNPFGGLDAVVTLANCTEVRGLINPYNDYLYAVARRGSQSVLFRVDPPSNTYAELGYFTTSFTGPVWMTMNSTQILIVDGVTGYVFTPSTGTFVQITDPLFPGASSATSQDGYGLFTKPDSTEWFFSNLYDFSAFSVLDFYNVVSSPDLVMAMLSLRREPWIFKQKNTEIWYDAGGDNTSIDNPTFAPNTGGLIPYGLGAVASPVIFDNTMCWLSEQGQMLQAQGYVARTVGNDMFGREVKTYSDFSDAISFSFIDQEHTFWQLTFVDGNATWVYDAKTKMLCKRQSYLDGGGWGRHRANCYALLNNKHYVGDYSNGKVYEMSQEYYDDDGHDIKRTLYTQEMDGGQTRLFFPAVQLIVDAGRNVSQGLDPQIMLEVSNDGANTWGPEMWRSAGKVGEYRRRAIWHQMGSGYRRIYRFTFTDAVPWRILGVSYSTGEDRGVTGDA